MASSTSNGDDKVVRFPSTPEERRAHHRARQEAERQRLINLFLDEEAGNQALFRTPTGECYADLMPLEWGAKVCADLRHRPTRRPHRTGRHPRRSRGPRAQANGRHQVDRGE